MPKLKQPIKLQWMAYNVLLKYVVDCCVRLSNAGCLNEMREVVAFVKKTVYTHIPMHFVASFAMKFFSEFFAQNLGNKRPSSHNKVVLEAILDANINEFKCTDKILKHLDAENVHRLPKLYVINLNLYSKLLIPLENFRLEYLQKFDYPTYCTNAELMVIGRNCRQLKYLYIDRSKITDVGLRALAPCTELRALQFSSYGLQFDTFVHVLSVHKQLDTLILINDIFFGDRNRSKHLDIYPSIRCLSIEAFDSSFTDLKYVVKKFPNLTDLTLEGQIYGNFSDLKNLSQLARIRFCYVYDIEYGSNLSRITLNSFKQLLTIIGKNITSLEFHSWVSDDNSLVQSDLNFLFDSCPNLESLEFECSYSELRLVMPSFLKLRQLTPHLGYVTKRRYRIEFGVMPKLEFLSFCLYESVSLNLEYLKSIVLNSVHFPELRVLELYNETPKTIVRQLQKLIIENNLQLKISIL